MTRVALIAAMLYSANAAAQPHAIAVNVDGIISPITVEIVGRALDQARTEKADFVLMRLNTPGGLIESSREIVEKMAASPAPIVTFVAPSGARAASAGFFLLEAGDLAAMATGTNTGAASPVLLGQQMDPVMRKKIENDTSAWLRSITSRRARNSDLAQTTIADAKAFTDKEALDQHLIEAIAPDERALLAQIDGHEITRWNGSKARLRTGGAVVREYQRTTRERLMTVIADPNLAFILLILGALGLYVEFTTPGVVIPGAIGGILLLLGLSGLSVVPINWVGGALLLLALALFVLEAKFAAHGTLGTGGAVAMLLGALLLVDGPPEVRIRFTTALGVTIPFALITIFLVSLILKARAGKVVTGVSGMIDEIGVARTPLNPDGQIMIRGEYWHAVSTQPVEQGFQVRVRQIDGLTLKVEPWGEEAPRANVG